MKKMNQIILMVLATIIGTSSVFAMCSSKTAFTGFIVTQFEPVQNVFGEENIDLEAPRDSALLQVVMGSVANQCDVYSNENDLMTCEFVKQKLRTKAKFSRNIGTMVVWIGSHGFVRNGELNVVFSDSILRIENGEVVSAENTMSGSELANILMEFECEKLVLVLDCCHSGNTGALTRMADQIDETHRGPKSIAILSSSATGQKSQVFLRRGVSMFTGFVLAALAGMGDENVDGKITVQEIYNYASSLVEFYSKMQERELGNVESFVLKNVGKKYLSYQRPELKTIIKGGDADISFGVPQLPYDVSMNFLCEHICDTLNLYGIAERSVRVDDFAQKGLPMDSQPNRMFGREISATIRKAITPNVVFAKSITDQPRTFLAEKYEYAVQGTYEPVRDGDKVSMSVYCKVVNLETNIAISTARLIINDMAEVGSVVLPGTANPAILRVTMKRRFDGRLQSLPKYAGGGSNDHAVEKGDRLVVKMENLSNEAVGVMCFVDGLNVMIREGETDADRVNTKAEHIRKKHYVIVPAGATRFINGWTKIRNGKFEYSHFVVNDAPDSLRERLKIDPEVVDSPLGEIRVLAFKTVVVRKIERGEAGIGSSEDCYTSNAIKSQFKIPSSQEEPLESVVIHYAFAAENE